MWPSWRTDLNGDLMAFVLLLAAKLVTMATPFTSSGHRRAGRRHRGEGTGGGSLPAVIFLPIALVLATACCAC